MFSMTFWCNSSSVRGPVAFSWTFSTAASIDSEMTFLTPSFVLTSPYLPVGVAPPVRVFLISFTRFRPTPPFASITCVAVFSKAACNLSSGGRGLPSSSINDLKPASILRSCAALYATTCTSSADGIPARRSVEVSPASSSRCI